MNDRSVVLIVVVALSSISLLGLASVIWLVHAKVAADQLAIVVALVGPAIGALGSVLSMTHSAPPEG